MSTPVKLTFDLSASQDNSGIEIFVQLDQAPPQCIKVGTMAQQVSLVIDDDQETEHELRIVMAGKTAQHTKLDSNGNIIEDVMVFVNSETCMLDDINIATLFWDLSTYHHNHNGTTDYANHKFYGAMGCNGTVTLKFSTPVYLWLLEHL